MAVFLRIITDNWYWISALFLLLALLFLRKAYMSRRDIRYTIFGLEKEQAQQRARKNSGRAFFMCLLAAAIYAACRYLAPLLPVTENRAATLTPTLSPARTPSSTPRSVESALTPIVMTVAYTPGATSATTSMPTVTPTISTTVTVAPTPTIAPAPASSGCLAQASISSPSSGAVVSGAVSIIGTANTDGFQFYKVEIASGDQPGSWQVLSSIHNRPVDGGLLDTWDTSSFPAGSYWLRLVVVDQTGNYPTPCQVKVTLNK